MQIFNCIGVGDPNLHAGPGSPVYYLYNTKINIIKKKCTI